MLAAGLTARLPELGSLGRRAIASLAGLAPHACDSGTLRGRHHTWGGRAEVRRMLYLAALTGSRCDPRLGAIRAGFETDGKPAKVAITATARQMLTIINAMLRDGTEYVSRPV